LAPESFCRSLVSHQTSFLEKLSVEKNHDLEK
jgi:hypothetical protein